VPPSFQDLAAELYVSLMTFRRNGVGVATPIWIAPAQGKLYVVTDGTSAKMKRLRVTDRIRLAACDLRGKVRGEYADGRSRTIEDPALVERAIAALSRKYGWRFGLASFFSRLFGRIGQRAYLEITLCKITL
jgi:PPOX class probable F420-dependent enzyme